MQMLSQKTPAGALWQGRLGSWEDRNIMIDFSSRFSNVLARVVQAIVLNSFNSLYIYGYFSLLFFLILCFYVFSLFLSVSLPSCLFILLWSFPLKEPALDFIESVLPVLFANSLISVFIFINSLLLLFVYILLLFS